MATHSSVLAWRIPGRGNLVGCHLWGRTESDTTEAIQQQQQQQANFFTLLFHFHQDFIRSLLNICQTQRMKYTKCYESESEVAQSCPTLQDPTDCSLPGFSVHGVFQARILQWVAISFSKGCSPPRDRTQVSCVAGRCFTLRATREVL